MKKLKFDREYFLDKLKKAYKFVPTNSVIPAFENMRFTVIGNTMEILAADPECQIKLYCNVKSTEDVSFCAPAHLLLKTVELFLENEVTITFKSEEKIELKCGKSKYNITLSCKYDQFPIMLMQKLQEESEFVIHQNDLRTGIKMSKKFINENSKAAVSAQGINMNNVNEKIVFTGLDGFTLGRAEVSPLGIGSWHSNFIIPEDSASKIASMLNDKGEIVIAHHGEKMILFTDDRVEKFEIITSSINSKFPDSEKLFSKKGSDNIIINTNEFKSAILRLKLYAGVDDSDKRIVVSFDGKETLVMTSQCNAYQRDGEEDMSVHGSDKLMRKAFNAESILKVLSCISSNEIALYFNDNQNIPVFIQPVEEDNFCFIIGTVAVD
jgi:DNA polymerase III subunit beta